MEIAPLFSSHHLAPHGVCNRKVLNKFRAGSGNVPIAGDSINRGMNGCGVVGSKTSPWVEAPRLPDTSLYSWNRSPTLPNWQGGIGPLPEFPANLADPCRLEV